jgi:hypothetical protein
MQVSRVAASVESTFLIRILKSVTRSALDFAAEVGTETSKTGQILEKLETIT